MFSGPIISQRPCFPNSTPLLVSNICLHQLYCSSKCTTVSRPLGHPLHTGQGQLFCFTQGNRPSLLFLKPNSVKTFLESCFSQGNKSTSCLPLYRCHGLKASQGVFYSKDHRSIRRREETQGKKRQTPDRNTQTSYH